MEGSGGRRRGGGEGEAEVGGGNSRGKWAEAVCGRWGRGWMEVVDGGVGEGWDSEPEDGCESGISHEVDGGSGGGDEASGGEGAVVCGADTDHVDGKWRMAEWSRSAGQRVLGRAVAEASGVWERGKKNEGGWRGETAMAGSRAGAAVGGSDKE